MVRIRSVLAPVCLFPLLGLAGCSFVRDLAIDAFLPEARPLIEELRKANAPSAETPGLVEPDLKTPTPVSPPAVPETSRPVPVPPPAMPRVLSPEDQEERAAIELYERRLEELKRALEQRPKPTP